MRKKKRDHFTRKKKRGHLQQAERGLLVNIIRREKKEGIYLNSSFTPHWVPVNDAHLGALQRLMEKGQVMKLVSNGVVFLRLTDVGRKRIATGKVAALELLGWA